jgi:hypothetical protein
MKTPSTVDDWCVRCGVGAVEARSGMVINGKVREVEDVVPVGEVL